MVEVDPDESRRLATWLRAWPLAEPIALRPTGGGINNRTFFVDTPGGTFFLRLYQNTADPERVRYEHAVLRALQAEPLPFRVPAPVPARDRETLVAIPDGKVGALFELLEGEPPTDRGVDYARAGGAALAQLHGALRAIDAPACPDPVTFGALERIHPLVPDPWSIGDDRVRAILAQLRGAIPRLYAELPRQLCHNDYSLGNTLQVDGRLTAIIDFEFVGPDLRALDLVAGWLFSMDRGSDPAEQMRRVGAFFDGYRWVDRLTPAEAGATPTLARLVRATHMVHWLGRNRAGLDPDNHHAGDFERFVQFDAWLDEHGDQLIALAGGQPVR
jgi:homoserine kinase type II